MGYRTGVLVSMLRLESMCTATTASRWEISTAGQDEFDAAEAAVELLHLGEVALEVMTNAGVGVLDTTSSALFVDFRNCGLQDLVVLRPDGPLLFLNQGDSRFRLQPGAFRFRTAPQGSFTGMAAADYDRDGHVDLYLCTYSFFRDGGHYRYPTPYHDARNGPPNFLFRNQLAGDGSGMFLDVTESVGLNQNNTRFSFAPAWCDYDGDGWPDLFVANDFGRKNLYKNENGKLRCRRRSRSGRYRRWDERRMVRLRRRRKARPVRLQHVERRRATHRFGKELAAGGCVAPACQGQSLYRNRGDGTFEETGAAEGVEMGRWAYLPTESISTTTARRRSS
jgi:hypothetical protein